ncbi:hypothetical protein TNCV_1035231 [Trichonephila clavipes]|nr:hypothetical protein TNCV_1035231 [Trichonephila clavipes]
MEVSGSAFIPLTTLGRQDGKGATSGVSCSQDLTVGKSWSRLLDGQRPVQCSALPRVEGVACLRVITEHDYLQAHLFKIGLAVSLLCPFCKSVPIRLPRSTSCSLARQLWSSPFC